MAVVQRPGDLGQDGITTELKEPRHSMFAHYSSSEPEDGYTGDAHLQNTTVASLAWRGVTVTVKDRNTKQLRNIVDNVEGLVEAGEICALMGPSGCGKTTLLNVLAHRSTNAREVAGSVLVNGSSLPLKTFRDITCFVEQEDALIGSLTVKETLNFAARLSTSSRSVVYMNRLHGI
jgi:ABC-type multidrug transport system ATPase subunit